MAKNNSKKVREKRKKKKPEKAEEKLKKEKKIEIKESELEKALETKEKEESEVEETTKPETILRSPPSPKITFEPTSAPAPTLTPSTPAETLEEETRTAPESGTRTTETVQAKYVPTYEDKIYQRHEEPLVSEMRKRKVIINPEVLARERTMIMPANPEWEEVARIEQETRSRRDYTVREAGMFEEERDKSVFESRERRKYRARG